MQRWLLLRVGRLRGVVGRRGAQGLPTELPAVSPATGPARLRRVRSGHQSRQSSGQCAAQDGTTPEQTRPETDRPLRQTNQQGDGTDQTRETRSVNTWTHDTGHSAAN